MTSTRTEERGAKGQAGLEPVFSCGAAVWYEEQLFGGDAARIATAMATAGRAIADAAGRDIQMIGGWSAAPRILGLIGKGNNGGDALIAIGHLLDEIPRAHAVLLCGFAPEQFGAHAAAVYDALLERHPSRLSIITLDGDWQAATRAVCFDLMLDGLFGMQFRAPMRAPFESLIGHVNSASLDCRLRIAIDLPSGVGDSCAAEPFRADYTYVMGTMKAPALNPANLPWLGRVRYLDAGFPSARAMRNLYLKNQYFATGALLEGLARPRAASADKRRFGHVGIVAGSLAMPGAAALGALGCVRAGAGLVTVFAPRHVAACVAGVVPEAMWTVADPEADGALAEALVDVLMAHAERLSALVVGPGLPADERSQAVLARIAAEVEAPMVIDASALRAPVIAACAARGADAGPVVITPHAGELRRLLPGWDDGSAEGDACVAAFARANRIIVVLKGPVTRVYDGESIVHVFGGGPVLARGGSGDVLAGMLGTLLAQRPDEALEQAAAAVLWHASAADLLARSEGEATARVALLPDWLGPALRGIKRA